MADAAGDAGGAEAGEVADEELVASPVDLAVDEGVDPDGEEEEVLDGAEQEVSEVGDGASEPVGLECVAEDAEADEDEESAPGQS